MPQKVADKLQAIIDVCRSRFSRGQRLNAKGALSDDDLDLLRLELLRAELELIREQEAP